MLQQICNGVDVGIDQSPGSGPEKYLSQSVCSHPLGVVTSNPHSQGQLCSVPRQGAGPTLPSVVASEGQGSFSHSNDPRDSIDGKGLGREVRYLSLIHSTSQQTRDRASSPVLTSSRPATPISRPSFTAQAKCGPAFPNAAAGEGQGQLSCSHDPRVSAPSIPPSSCRWPRARVGEGISVDYAVELQTNYRASSPMLTPLWPARPHASPSGTLWYYPGEV